MRMTANRRKALEYMARTGGDEVSDRTIASLLDSDLRTARRAMHGLVRVGIVRFKGEIPGCDFSPPQPRTWEEFYALPEDDE